MSLRTDFDTFLFRFVDVSKFVKNRDFKRFSKFEFSVCPLLHQSW